MTADMLPLFQIPCLCLLGEQQSQPAGHPGACLWSCIACNDEMSCDACRMELLIEDLNPTWNTTLSRNVVTVAPQWGLFDGWATEVDIQWHRHHSGRRRISVHPLAPDAKGRP